jgi:Tfp pilus assembly protein PilN
LREREHELDQRIVEAEQRAAPTREAARAVRSASERWRAMRDVIEPRRYPLRHLDHVARVMPEGGVVLGDFESKGAEVTLRGRARAAGEAFAFVRSLNADEEARLFGWSMPEPQVGEDGSATFEIKGAMR